VSLSNIESLISGALSSQSFNKTPSIRVVGTIWSSDFDALEKVLELQALAVGKPASGESVWLPTSAKKIKAER
jgi:hypothetical protein